MPRKARIDAPLALQHIIMRRIERKPISKDFKDYQNFIERLNNILTDTSTSCYTYAGGEFNFNDTTNKDLAFVVKKLNHRPRKGLNYQTPHGFFYRAIGGALAT